MKRLIFYFSVIVSSVSIPLVTLPVERITSFSQVQTILDQADEETLVIFDVDDTLVRPVDKIFQTQYEHLESRLYTDNKLSQFIQKDEQLLSILYKHMKRELIEPFVAEIITRLQVRGVKVLACTLWRVGSYGAISQLEEFRFMQLKELGIDFTPSFNTIQVFDHLPQYRNCSPLLYKGILFTNLCPKGEVLGAFLDTLDWQPRKVIFFDDRKSNLTSVQDELAKRDIMFFGYHYKMAQDHESAFNPIIAQAQVNHFIKYNVWLSESEIQKHLGLS